jgi:predicted double-glycine peptidase
MKRKLTAAITVTVLLAAAHSGWGQGVQTSVGSLRIQKNVQSLQELREGGVVRQKWDLSCGAAALSTLLTYDLHEPATESEIVVWILHRTNPVKIKARGGFSLFDLKRYAKFRGFNSEGYAGLDLKDLVGLGRPAIVATQVNSFNHFMVFRGLVADRVILADPAFGNTTLTTQQFKEIWKKGIAFLVLPTGSTPPSQLQPKRTDLMTVDESIIFRQALDRSIAKPTRY